MNKINLNDKLFRTEAYECGWYMNLITKRLKEKNWGEEMKKFWLEKMQWVIEWKKDLSKKGIIIPQVDSDNLD